MTKTEKYSRVEEPYPLPGTMEALLLSGVGMENLRLERVPVPDCGPGQLLARVDAAVACASDNKLIDQGADHPLMYGWDVCKYPVIIGHEGAVTAVKVGKHLQPRYQVGQRFAVQPAIPSGPYHHRERYRNNAEGISKVAMGYTLPGLFAEYVLITEEVLGGGCLLPLPEEKIPYFGAALAEPLSCVIAAQQRTVHILKESPSAPRCARLGLKKGGRVLIMGAGPMGLMHIEVAMSYHPELIVVSEPLVNRLGRARYLFEDKAGKLGIALICTSPEKLKQIVATQTKGMGFDDIIVAVGNARVQEKSFEYLAKGGVTNLFGGTRADESSIQVDTRRIHYDGISVVGSSGSDSSDVAQVLEMMAAGAIDPGNYIVKCGGLDSAVALIQALRERKIDGKGVIYPHTRAPLTDIQGWNGEKEREFLERWLLLTD